MQISQIRLENYKSIEEVSIGLAPINILIGANGAGKSNFISVFKLLNNIVEENLQNYIASQGGANNLLHFGAKNSQKITINIEFKRTPSHDNGYICELSYKSGDTLYFSKEWPKYRDSSRFTTWLEQTDLGSGHLETELFNHRRISAYVTDVLKAFKIYHFHDTSPEAAVKQSCKVMDNQVLRYNASNLAAFLYKLKTIEKYRDYYNNIESTIKLIAPFFDRFDLKINALNSDNILLEWKEVGSDQYFNADHLSDGTLRMICLITLLLQPELPDTIIIDEPEIGLHPYAISVLASLIKKTSVKSQIIISTQSVSLINHFNPSDIIVVNRGESGKSTFKRIEEKELEDWLNDYELGEIWEKNLIGGRP